MIKLIAPDRIFIGGGGTAIINSIPVLYNRLKDHGIIVANIIGLENLATTTQIISQNSYIHKIRSLNITNYRKIQGSSDLSIPEPQKTLFQAIIWKVRDGENE
ncbi:MAG: hypothetical protein MZU97_01655 [Bacillus subtilis]|nr:hypothetical protein [Bacillus subtilis]